jgi:hypothetical protein
VKVKKSALVIRREASPFSGQHHQMAVLGNLHLKAVH